MGPDPLGVLEVDKRPVGVHVEQNELDVRCAPGIIKRERLDCFPIGKDNGGGAELDRGGGVHRVNGSQGIECSDVVGTIAVDGGRTLLVPDNRSVA